MKLIHVGLSVLTSTCKSAKEANVHVFSTENQIKVILSKIRSAGGNTLGIGLPALKKKLTIKTKVFFYILRLDRYTVTVSGKNNL